MKKQIFTVAITIIISATLAAQSSNKVSQDVDTTKAAIAERGNDFIKPDAKTQPGFFTVYIQDDKYYFEIPDSLLGRDILIVNRVVRAVANSGMYAGDEIGELGKEKIIRFEKDQSNKINLYNISYNVLPKDSTSPMFVAVNNSNQQPVLATYDIKAISKKGEGSIIEVTDLVKGGGILAGSSAKTITTVKAYPTNIEIGAVRNVEYTPRPSGSEDNSQPAPTATGGEMEMNSSLLLLAGKPMRARYFDERIGYFSVNTTDFDEDHIRKIKMIHRWRLEPREKDMDKYKRGELVEPKKPIIIYIDRATPAKWVPWLVQSVNNWQPVFEKAGFKNAIIGKVAPTREEDSTWSLDDARNSAIVYKPSSTQNAFGYHIADPRSGEILESHINWYHNIMKWVHDRYMIEAGPNDTGATKMYFDDSLMGHLIEEIATHEVGHAVGLLHNFGASSTVPVEKLRDSTWVETNGISPSIMDYTRYNYVAQPGDNISKKAMINHIGDYDRWAIEWGYRLFPQFAGPDDEKTYLNQWIREKLKDRRLWWGDGEDALSLNDPRSQREDLGDNAVQASDYGIKNLKRVILGLRQWTRVSNENYDNLTDLYHNVIDFNINDMGVPLGAYSRYVMHVVKIIGGMYKTPRVVEDATPVYEPVPKNRQRDAVYFLNRQLFTTPDWLFDSSIISRTGDNPLSLISRIQYSVLQGLFFQSMRNLARGEAVLGKNAYTVMDLLNDLKKGIWTELALHKSIDIYRRVLQKIYVDKLASLLTPQGGSAEMSGIISAHLSALQKEITSAQPAIKDEVTRYHLQEVLNRIEQALKVNGY